VYLTLRGSGVCSHADDLRSRAELIGAGMLILAGGGRGFPLDYDELERWTRIGYERGMRSRKGER
jgi:hypothetical protein